MYVKNKVTEPGDIADSILWLTSTDASFVTGEIMMVDSGLSLAGPNYIDYEKKHIVKEKKKIRKANPYD